MSFISPMRWENDLSWHVGNFPRLFLQKLSKESHKLRCNFFNNYPCFTKKCTDFTILKSKLQVQRKDVEESMGQMILWDQRIPIDFDLNIKNKLCVFHAYSFSSNNCYYDVYLTSASAYRVVISFSSYTWLLQKWNSWCIFGPSIRVTNW